MSRSIQEKKIDGVTWSVQPFPGMEGLRMQARLIKLIGPSLGAIVADGLDTDVGKVITNLVQATDSDETPQLIRDLVSECKVDGEDMKSDRAFDRTFTANYGNLYKGLAFVIQVNFGDVFTMARDFGFLGDAQAPEEE